MKNNWRVFCIDFNHKPVFNKNDVLLNCIFYCWSWQIDVADLVKVNFRTKLFAELALFEMIWIAVWLFIDKRFKIDVQTSNGRKWGRFKSQRGCSGKYMILPSNIFFQMHSWDIEFKRYLYEKPDIPNDSSYSRKAN